MVVDFRLTIYINWFVKGIPFKKVCIIHIPVLGLAFELPIRDCNSGKGLEGCEGQAPECWAHVPHQRLSRTNLRILKYHPCSRTTPRIKLDSEPVPPCIREQLRNQCLKSTQKINSKINVSSKKIELIPGLIQWLFLETGSEGKLILELIRGLFWREAKREN